MKKYWFNTGVKPYGHNPPIKLGEHQEWRNGTMQIAFYCEGVPEGAIFNSASDNKDLYKDNSVMVTVPILKGGLESKYAHFNYYPNAYKPKQIQ